MPDNVPQVYADSDGATRVLNNLLGNAFKFTEDGGRITVRVDPRAGGESGDRFVGVRVTDNGIGISERDQARIFDRFTQVQSRLTGKPRGAGIGLAICREIVGKSGGEIWVRSQPGEGSTFGFTLPVAPEKPQAAPTSRASASGPG